MQTQLASWALMTSAFWSAYALRNGLPPMLAAPLLACVTPLACRRSEVVGGSVENTKVPGMSQELHGLGLCSGDGLWIDLTSAKEEKGHDVL